MFLELPTSSAIVTTPTTPTTTIRPYVNLACADDPCNGYECFNETDNGLLFRCQCPFPTVGPRCSMGELPNPLDFLSKVPK